MHFVLTHPMHRHSYDCHLATGAGVGEVAAATEEAGFSGIGLTDHSAPEKCRLQSDTRNVMEPFVALSYAAAHTTALRLIPSACQERRSPQLGQCLDVDTGSVRSQRDRR